MWKKIDKKSLDFNKYPEKEINPSTWDIISYKTTKKSDCPYIAVRLILNSKKIYFHF